MTDGCVVESDALQQGPTIQCERPCDWTRLDGGSGKSWQVAYVYADTCDAVRKGDKEKYHKEGSFRHDFLFR